LHRDVAGKDGVGAKEGEDPIGGGIGYHDVEQTRKYTVMTAEQLVKAVGNATIALINGEGYIIKNCHIHYDRNTNTGYGILLSDAKARVVSCLFNRNTVSVYGYGDEHCAMEFLHNVEMGIPYRACVEMGTIERDGRIVGGESLVIKQYIPDKHPSPYHTQIPDKSLEIHFNHFANTVDGYCKTNFY